MLCPPVALSHNQANLIASADLQQVSEPMVERHVWPKLNVNSRLLLTLGRSLCRSDPRHYRFTVNRTTVASNGQQSDCLETICSASSTRGTKGYQSRTLGIHLIIRSRPLLCRLGLVFWHFSSLPLEYITTCNRKFVWMQTIAVSTVIVCSCLWKL